ncbi:hypothetical protein KCMC57_64650 (plasmid) [Kitasatospora sp. CMC57]|uniref:Uncharacterized protein n=2 Tax=Kitasatospora sp. CMC57 TaxID=3231513 RepID=A0AB33K3C5_9ACTN
MSTLPMPASDPQFHCPTHLHYSTMPPDLRTWAQIAAEIADGPRPMSERSARRHYNTGGQRVVWTVPGRRGELVSLSAFLEFHRDLHRGWLRPQLRPRQ